MFCVVNLDERNQGEKREENVLHKKTRGGGGGGDWAVLRRGSSEQQQCAALSYATLCLMQGCGCPPNSQDVLYLGDDVLGVGALPLQGDAVPRALLVQPGQLRLGQRQAHAALVPAGTKTQEKEAAPCDVPIAVTTQTRRPHSGLVDG